MNKRILSFCVCAVVLMGLLAGCKIQETSSDNGAEVFAVSGNKLFYAENGSDSDSVPSVKIYIDHFPVDVELPEGTRRIIDFSEKDDILYLLTENHIILEDGYDYAEYCILQIELNNFNGKYVAVPYYHADALYDQPQFSQFGLVNAELAVMCLLADSDVGFYIDGCYYKLPVENGFRYIDMLVQGDKVYLLSEHQSEDIAKVTLLDFDIKAIETRRPDVIEQLFYQSVIWSGEVNAKEIIANGIDDFTLLVGEDGQIHPLRISD